MIKTPYLQKSKSPKMNIKTIRDLIMYYEMQRLQREESSYLNCKGFSIEPTHSS